MRYPKKIKANDAIALISPSFGCSIEPYRTRLMSAITKLSQLGYIIKSGDNVFNNKGFLSATPKECGEEFMQAFLSADAILSVAGGEMMTEILPFIDFKRLSIMEPKWFMGYSDNTNITFLLATLADCASIYGYNAPYFGMEEYHQSHEDCLALLRKEQYSFKGYSHWEADSTYRKVNPLARFQLTEEVAYKSLLPGKQYFKGRLIGGCLDCLLCLVGTEYDKVSEVCSKYAEDGIIFFFECCDMTSIDLKRALIQLKRANWFNNVVGFLFGRPYLTNQDWFGLTFEAAIADVLGEMDVPVIMDLDFGHRPPAMPLLTGAIAEVTFDKEFTIKYILD